MAKTTLEAQFISAVLLAGDMGPAMEARITPEFFYDEFDGADVWRWATEYHAEYGECPTSAALKQHFPDYRLIRVEEPLAYYIDLLVEQRRHYVLQTGIIHANEILQEERSPTEAAAVLTEVVSQVHLTTSRTMDVDFSTNWEERLARYEGYRDLKDGMRGIPSGFPSLDKALAGFQPGQLITIIGEPKAGKSTLLLKMALNAHQWTEPHPIEVAFIGFEMSNHEQESRADAMITRIPHAAITTGQLSDSELRRMQVTLGRHHEKYPHPFHFVSDPHSTTTVSGVRSKIGDLQPDIVFIDGVYMMEDERGEAKGSPQALTNLTRDFKKMAQLLNIPVVISTQALTWKVSKKQGISTASIGYSSSFAQDSDAIIGTESTDTDTMKRVSITDARNAPRMAVLVMWDWETSDFRELGEEREDDDEPGGGFEQFSRKKEEETGDMDDEPVTRRRRLVS